MVSGSRTRPVTAASRTRNSGGERKSYPPRDGERKSYPPRDGERKSYPPRDGERKSYPPRDGERKPYPPRRERSAPRRRVRPTRSGADRVDHGGLRPEENRPVRSHHDDPFIPDDITPADLNAGARNELKTLSKENAEWVARHLAMASQAHRGGSRARAPACRLGIASRRPHRDRARDAGDHGVRDGRLRPRAARAAHLPAHLGTRRPDRAHGRQRARRRPAGSRAGDRSRRRPRGAPHRSPRRTRDRDVGRSARSRPARSGARSSWTSPSWIPTAPSSGARRCSPRARPCSRSSAATTRPRSGIDAPRSPLTPWTPRAALGDLETIIVEEVEEIFIDEPLIRR